MQRSFALPAAGYRNNSSGTSNNQGSNGNYWSSSVSGTNARNVNFNSGTVNGNTNNRANGFSVRCVQVFTGRSFFWEDAEMRKVKMYVNYNRICLI